MSSVRLPHGVLAPRLGLGTFQLEGRTCRRIVEEALALGYRHVDTAEGYLNEEEVGRALRASGVPRDRIFLVSKVGRDHLRSPDLRRCLEDSLRRLGVDGLDLYLVHWPDSAVPAAEIAGGMEALRAEGLLRAWGVSNYTIRHLEEILPHARVSTNQVELHPHFAQRELAAFCGERAIPLTAYSPLARGRVIAEPLLRDIGDAHGCSPARVTLAWALGQGHLVIPKAARSRHLRDNLAALDLELTADEMTAIDALPRGERLFDFEWAEFDR